MLDKPNIIEYIIELVINGSIYLTPRNNLLISGFETREEGCPSQDLYSKGVYLIIGPHTSGEASAMKQFADQHQMILFSMSSTALTLAIPNDSLFRNTPTVAADAIVVSNLMWSSGIRAIALIWRGDTYGDSLVQQVNKTFTAMGGKVVPAVRYPIDTTDFSGYANTLANVVSQLVNQYVKEHVAVYDVSFIEVVGIFQAASQYDILKQVRWFADHSNAGAVEIINNPIAAQMAYSTSYLTPIYAPTHSIYYDQVTQYINKTLGRVPNSFSYSTYDIFWIYVYTVLKVIQAKGIGILSDQSSFIKEVYNALMPVGNHYFGASGLHKFDQNGDRIVDAFVIMKVNYTSTGYKWVTLRYYNSSCSTLTQLKDFHQTQSTP